VGILQAFAEEEAAKALLLFDSLRCPEDRGDDLARLKRQFDQHLAKLICAEYYNTAPADLAEVGHIIENGRRNCYREGQYGEYILPNHMLYMRERRLYVDYFRHADGSRIWQVPYPAEWLFGRVVASWAIEVASALFRLGILSERSLRIVSRFWNEISPDEIDRRGFEACNLEMLQELRDGGIIAREGTEAHAATIRERLLYPLYPFDLSPIDNFDDLPGPDWPDYFDY
jgi:hypothetical protein